LSGSASRLFSASSLNSIFDERSFLMATISASAVKDLREKTGVGMMEAKKALEETSGDFEKAVDLLRKKGLSAAAKTGVMIEVNSETDFVAKNEDFQHFAKDLAELVAAEHPADVAALSQLSIGSDTVEARRNALVQKIGENIAIRRFVCYETSGQIAIYVHGNKIGVMVDYTGGDAQLGKDLAMHIAAANPQFLNRETVPSDVLNRERAVYEAQAKESGKPSAIIGKMVEGKLEKFYSEACLMDQVYIKDPDGKLKIRDCLRTAGNIVLNRFVRYQLGEGIEKKKENFAEEVAAQLK
jgi:elongation factor Ts